MRATYVNGPEHLTPIGEWIAARLPHWDGPVNPWPWSSGEHRIFRIFGFRPFYRFCILDYTKAKFFIDRPAWVCLRVCGITIYERHRENSGLPGAR